MKEYSNFIGGTWVSSKSGKTFQISNPADTREVVTQYAAAEREDAAEAVRAAGEAFPAWAAMTPVARGRVLSHAGRILESRKAELAELLTREEGKTLVESGGEVQRAADIFRFFGGVSYTLGGRTIPHDLPNNLLYTTRQPLGVVGLITPWNFPVAIPAWKLAPALLGGNTVVLKPASQAPAMSMEIARALQEAGLPEGVFNVVIGSGSEVGDELATQEKVVALSFTGSHKVGHQIYQKLAGRMARAQMEMGGKNPAIVLRDADVDLAVNLVAKAGFGLTGQACTATSRAIVEKSVLDTFVDKLVEKARDLKVGNGLKQGIEMGPAVNQQELDGNLEYIEIARKEGATIAFGGERLSSGDYAHGYFLQPTVVTGVTPEMRIAQEEVFGPVISVIAVEDFNKAIEVANGVPYGLSASVVTRDVNQAMRYTDRIQAGVVKVNQVSTGLALQAPFGGVKNSSSDSFKEQGVEALEFYTRIRTVYLDYSAG